LISHIESNVSGAKMPLWHNGYPRDVPTFVPT
jgi:hypothetical protein